jgi:hypothetical protein
MSVSDEDAIAAAKVLLAYQHERLNKAQLDVIAEWHIEMIDRLRKEIKEIPRRTEAARRVADWYK